MWRVEVSGFACRQGTCRLACARLQGGCGCSRLPAPRRRAPERPHGRRLLPHAGVGGGLAEVGAGVEQAARHHDARDALHHAGPLALPAQQARKVVNQELHAQRRAALVAQPQPADQRHIPADGGEVGRTA